MLENNRLAIGEQKDANENFYKMLLTKFRDVLYFFRQQQDKGRPWSWTHESDQNLTLIKITMSVAWEGPQGAVQRTRWWRNWSSVLLQVRQS